MEKNCKLEIILKGDGWMVIKKPAGFLTTNEGVANKAVLSVENWLEDRGWGEKLVRRGVVHRLDKGTSGLVIVAEDEPTLDWLKKQFRNRLVIKKYVALVEGEAVGGEIVMPVGRLKGLGRFGVVINGRLAETVFMVKNRYFYRDRKYTLMEVWPKTGRTHQIRVHFSYLGWPIAGDRLYGGHGLLGLERQFLEAAELSFIDRQGNKVVAKSDLSADLVEVLKQL